MDQLSSIDASFLHLETPETPMHVGSLMLFELPEDYQGDHYEDVKAMLGKRLHLASVLTRKLAQMPFELAEPVWIEDDDIDLDYHVRSVILRRPGTMQQLEALIARLHSTLLDRSRPLWEMYVIEGLETGQIAVVSKMHHATVDGVSGANLMSMLCSLEPDAPLIDLPTGNPVGRAPSDTELFARGVLSTVAKPFQIVNVLAPTVGILAGAASRAPVARVRRLTPI